MGAEVHINLEALKESTKTPEMKEYLKRQAEALNEKALENFKASTQGKSTPPIFYADSFEVRDLPNEEGVQAVNVDPTAIWVEYGALAEGVTRVLGYRPYGKAIDQQEQQQV